VLVIVIAVAAAAGPAPAPASADVATRLVGALRGDDLMVSRGYPKLYTQRDCDRFTYPIMRNCYANNPAAPYVVPVVKSWKDEFVDPATVNAWGRTRPGYSVSYRLDPREAIVVFGRLPPPGRYMGLQSYVFTKRWLTDDLPWQPSAYSDIQSRAPELVDYLFSTVPRNPSRVMSVSTLGNSINNVVIQRQSGAAFGRIRSFIVTPDRGMDRVVRRALGRLGVPAKDVFTEPIPPSHPLGLDAEADDFVTGMRYAQPDDPRAGRAWQRDLPLTVLRVREKPASDRVAQRFPRFTVDPRTAVPEAGYAPDLDDLVRQVCRRWGQPCDPANPDPDRLRHMIDLQLDLGDFGPQCRTIGMDCIGDGQDASYFIAPGHPLDPGLVWAVVGTLATETGNATYVGLSINDLTKLKGVLNVSDADLAGSAGPYAGTVANTAKFFVHYFTRDCGAITQLTDGHCTTITTDMVPPRGSGKQGLFSAAVRSYVRPGTDRGPLSSEQLRPITIRFAQP